jgi:hypothetical protein
LQCRNANGTVKARDHSQPSPKISIGSWWEDLGDPKRQQVEDDGVKRRPLVSIVAKHAPALCLDQRAPGEIQHEQDITRLGSHSLVGELVLRTAQQAKRVAASVAIVPLSTNLVEVDRFDSVACGRIFDQREQQGTGDTLDASLEVVAAGGGDVQQQPRKGTRSWKLPGQALGEPGEIRFFRHGG